MARGVPASNVPEPDDAALATRWRIHAVVAASRANGPGMRFTIWSQGCTLGCPGCFNPGTHPSGWPAEDWPVGKLIAAVAAQASRIEGVTLTGGEPLEQPAAVAAFCREIRARTNLGIIILSGFTQSEIEADPARMAAVTDADMIIAGRYNASLHLGTGLRGSSNKEYWARTGRYCARDFAAVPDLEIAVAADGMITVSGMPDGMVTFGGMPGQPGGRDLHQ
jgi:anaerobic ribonucleoside-triphosphate reductase activating protein